MNIHHTLMKIIVVVILLLLYTLCVSKCIDEQFSIQPIPHNQEIQLSNSSNELKDRHPIDSIPYNIQLKQKYENAYYYELSNDDYLKFLKEYFSTCIDGIPDFSQLDWDTNNVDQSFVKGFYNQSYQYLANRMNRYNIQIVHDILNRYKTIDNNKFMFDIDVILYRNGKINGKHVKFILFQDYTRTIVIHISIEGIVGEDKIYMHPVESYQKPHIAYEKIEEEEEE